MPDTSLVCAKYLQLGPLGPSLTTISKTSKGYTKHIVECETELAAWKSMQGQHMGVRSDEDGALFIGTKPTNIELKDSPGGASKLRLNFSATMNPKLDLVIWGDSTFVRKAFILSTALARSRCPSAFECLQPIDAKFDRIACGTNPCLTWELLQVPDFIEFWLRPNDVKDFSPERSRISFVDLPFDA